MKKQSENNVNKKKRKTVLRILLLVMVALILGINIYTLNASRLAGNAVPMPFGFGAAVVLSGSMEPELSTGDLIFVVEQDSYAEGDVVVFQDGRMSVTHRIISIDGDQIVTKGDANNAEDAPISYDQIKGTVAFSIPWVGYLVNLIVTPIGTILILGVAIFLVEFSFRSEKSKDKQELDAIRAEIEKLKQNQEN